jgi:beta-glucosidase/6-phospho-beta-glucosidase/beta-galactosidase
MFQRFDTLRYAAEGAETFDQLIRCLTDYLNDLKYQRDEGVGFQGPVENGCFKLVTNNEGLANRFGLYRAENYDL